MTVRAMEQGSLLPPDSLDTLLNDADRLMVRLRKLAPLMDGQERLLNRAELSLHNVVLDSIEHGITARVAHQARRLGLLA